MGKVPYTYTDSDETEDTCSSVENVKKKKKLSALKRLIKVLAHGKRLTLLILLQNNLSHLGANSYNILKCSNGNMKKKKCKFHAKSEPDDSDCRSRSGSRSSQSRFVYKLHGILKNDKEKEYMSSDEDEDVDRPRVYQSQDRCLVGRVPRIAGAKPGRGGGLAIVVRKNTSVIPPSRDSSSNELKRRHTKRLARKKSY